MVSLAQVRIARGRKTLFVTTQLPHQVASLAEVAPIVRGACSRKDDTIEGAWRRLVLDFRSGEAILNFFDATAVQPSSQAGVITPDHTIRTKNWPLVLSAPAHHKLDCFRKASRDAAEDFVAKYEAYFRRNNVRCGGTKRML